MENRSLCDWFVGSSASTVTIEGGPKGAPRKNPTRHRGLAVAGMYAIPKKAFTSKHRKRLTIEPRQTFGAKKTKKDKAGMAAEEVAEDEPDDTAFPIYDTVSGPPGTVLVPREYGRIHWGGAADTSGLSDGVPLPPGTVFGGKLRTSPEYPQHRAFRALERYYDVSKRSFGGGLLVVKCGFGKTVLAAALIARLGRRTIFFVAQKRLGVQAEETFAWALPGLRVGWVQGPRDEWDADIVICTVQTIVSPSRAYTEADFAPFGLAIFDEAHHHGAKTFSAVFPLLAARWRLGLTCLLYTSPSPRD